MDVGDCVGNLVHEVRDHLAQRSAGRLVDAFVADLDGLDVPALPDRSARGRAVPGVRHAPAVLHGPDAPATRRLLPAVRSAFGHVHWTRWYGSDAWSQPFLDDFAVGDAIGPAGRLVHHDVALGLLILGPDRTYPVHAHASAEFYVVVSGSPSIRIEDAEEVHPPGSVVAWDADVGHEFRTGAQPFLGVWGRRGDLGGHSWYRDDDVGGRRYPPVEDPDVDDAT